MHAPLAAVLSPKWLTNRLEKIVGASSQKYVPVIDMVSSALIGFFLGLSECMRLRMRVGTLATLNIGRPAGGIMTKATHPTPNKSGGCGSQAASENAVAISS